MTTVFYSLFLCSDALQAQEWDSSYNSSTGVRPEVSPDWLKIEGVSPAVAALSTAVMVRGADQPWQLRPPLTVSPLLVSTPSWFWTFWLLWVVLDGAVRLWAGLLRPRPGAGAVAAVAVGADGAVCITCSSVGLFLKGSRLGLLRPEAKRHGSGFVDHRARDEWNKSRFPSVSSDWTNCTRQTSFKMKPAGLFTRDKLHQAGRFHTWTVKLNVLPELCETADLASDKLHIFLK